MPSAIRPRRLGHIVLMVRDIHKSAKFYEEIVGLKISDWIAEDMVFLRAAEDHHDLALAAIPPDAAERDDPPNYRRPGLEHFSYLVDSLDDMEAAAKFLQEQNIEIVRGIGKHGPGANCFLVFKDPDGNNVELYCEMTQIPLDAPHEAKVWERNIESFDRWRFARFINPPPDAVVKQKEQA
jgi:catechol-2,3-dioxygenase